MLESSVDYDYISLMKMPDQENTGLSNEIRRPSLSMTPSSGLKSSINLNSSMKKRKCSTPQEIGNSAKKHQPSPGILKTLSNQISATDAKSRVITSALRITRNSGSITKSVKFNASKFTRRITNEKYEDREEEVNSKEDSEQQENTNERRKLFIEDEETEQVEKTVCQDQIKIGSVAKVYEILVQEDKNNEHLMDQELVEDRDQKNSNYHQKKGKKKSKFVR